MSHEPPPSMREFYRNFVSPAKCQVGKEWSLLVRRYIFSYLISGGVVDNFRAI